MGAVKFDKKIEDKIQAGESDIVDLFNDLEKQSKVKTSYLSIDKAKSKLAEVTKTVEKLKETIKAQEKLLEKWDAS